MCRREAVVIPDAVQREGGDSVAVERRERQPGVEPPPFQHPAELRPVYLHLIVGESLRKGFVQGVEIGVGQGADLHRCAFNGGVRPPSPPAGSCGPCREDVPPGRISNIFSAVYRPY